MKLPQGVNTTRRFLCEALSFQSRYVPIGILETMPPLINDRSPPFRGRDELGEVSRTLTELCLLAPSQVIG